MTQSDRFEDAELLDTIGLMCPEPLLLARRRLDQLLPGQRLHVVASDPHSELDFEVFSRRTRTPLLAVLEQQGNWHFLLQKV